MWRVGEIQRTHFKVSQFLSWQRGRELTLSPSFQRRPVWKAGEKSYFIDTVVRGLPIPVVFLRERLDLGTQKTLYEVVDGQQRLRTLFAFIDTQSLLDYDAKRDEFLVSNSHNENIGGRKFSSLKPKYQEAILGYPISTHVLPSTVDDRQVLQIFARMNSTGVKANGQELRNARYFGLFKKLVYELELAYEQLERWRVWEIFSVPLGDG